MISKIKLYLIAIATTLLTILTLSKYAQYQKRRADKAESNNKQNQRIINEAIQHNKDVSDSYKLDADAINYGLRDDYRD